MWLHRKEAVQFVISYLSTRLIPQPYLSGYDSKTVLSQARITAVRGSRTHLAIFARLSCFRNEKENELVLFTLYMYEIAFLSNCWTLSARIIARIKTEPDFS